MAEKEPVEYETVIDENGRPKAANVTGPQGGFVQGAPKPTFRSYGDRDGGDDRGGQGGGFRPRGGRGGGFGGAPRGDGGYRSRDQGMEQ